MATKSKTAEAAADQQPQTGAGEEITGQQSQTGAGGDNAGIEPQTGAGEEITGQQSQTGTGDENAGTESPAPKQENPPRTKADRISESLQAVGRDVLANNPQFKAVYVTANGYVFPNESDAINHAKSLKNKKVETVTREE